MIKLIRICCLTTMLILLLFLADNYSKETKDSGIDDIDIIEESRDNTDDIYSSSIYEEHSENRIKGRIYDGTCPTIDSCPYFHVVGNCLYTRVSIHSNDPGVCQWGQVCVPADPGSSCESCDYHLEILQPTGPIVSIMCVLYYPRVIGPCCYQQDDR